MNANKTEYLCFKQSDNTSTQSGKPLKLVNQFIYLSNNISSTKRDVNIHFVKAEKAIDRLSIVWKPNQSDKKKQDFFQAIAISILLYGYTP